MLEELNIMKLNFEVKHRFDFSGTLRPFNFLSIQSIERSMAFTFNLTILHHKQGNQNNTKACSL